MYLPNYCPWPEIISFVEIIDLLAIGVCLHYYCKLFQVWFCLLEHKRGASTFSTQVSKNSSILRLHKFQHCYWLGSNFSDSWKFTALWRKLTFLMDWTRNFGKVCKILVKKQVLFYCICWNIFALNLNLKNLFKKYHYEPMKKTNFWTFS